VWGGLVARPIRAYARRIDQIHTQAKKVDELMERVREAIELCLEANRDESTNLELVGIQQISV
jgi:predicted RNase H-like HicB family nuclease